MAPLTWREVAAPNFSGVAESQRLAGTLLNSGFQSTIDALDGFGKGVQTSQSNEFAARVAGYGNDTNALQQALKNGTIYDGLGRNNISVDALKFGLGREGDVLANDGTRLINANRAEVNSQQAWVNDNAQSYEAGRPAAVDLVNQIRSASALGTPEGRAKADELMRGGSGVFSAAGWTPDQVNAQINGNLTTSEGGIGLNTELRGQDDAVLARNQDIEAKKLYASAMQGAGNDIMTAEKMVRENNKLDPQVAQRTLAMFGSEEAKLLQGPDTTSAGYLTQAAIDAQLGGPSAMARESGSPIVYANKDATRNDPLQPQLEQIMTPILQDLGVTMHVVSGGQETAAEIAAGHGSRTGSTRHDHGGAGDSDFYAADGHKLDPKNAQDLPILQEIVRRGWAKGITGWGEGENYMGSGRVHLGFGSPSMWGKDGKSENAPQWMKDAIAGMTPGTAPTIDSVAATARTGKVPGAPPASANPVKDLFESAMNSQERLSTDQNQALFDGATAITSQAASVMDAMTVDGLFGTQALAQNLLNPSLASESQAASIARLRTSLGPDMDIKDPELADNINAIKDKYGMSFGQAATVVENSLHQEPWILQWLQGKANVDYNRFDTLIGQVYNKDGKTKGEKFGPAMELLQSARSKQNAASKLSEGQGLLQAAQQRYVNLLGRAKLGSTPALDKELQRAQLEYQALLGQVQKTVTAIDSDPRLGLASGQ